VVAGAIVAGAVVAGAVVTGAVVAGAVVAGAVVATDTVADGLGLAVGSTMATGEKDVKSPQIFGGVTVVVRSPQVPSLKW